MFWKSTAAGAAHALRFPNDSRSYDESRRAVRFWGYDGAFEVPFLVGGDALLRLDSRMQPQETNMLSVFDAHVATIRSVASQLYASGRQGSYVLTSSNF